MPAMWVQEAPSTPANSRPCSRSSLSSYLSPETFNSSPWGPGKADLPPRFTEVTCLAPSGLQKWPFPSSPTTTTAKTGGTKPIAIPAACCGIAGGALPRTPAETVQQRDRKAPQGIIHPSSILSPESPCSMNAKVLGSWAAQQFVHSLKPEQREGHGSPMCAEDVATYGFFPPGFVLKEAPATSAFWPEVSNGTKGPIQAAFAGAQAANPPQRVAFQAACRVIAPGPPKVAKIGLRAPGVTLKPAKRSDKHLPVEERLWRLRAKRAWIREEIQALRGFPDKDADYAEPWADALALLQGMGGSGDMPGGEDDDSWRTSGNADAIGDDSALHERMMVGDDALDATSDAEALLGHAVMYKTSPDDSADDMSTEAPEEAPPMESVMPGVLMDAVLPRPPPEKPKQALAAPQAFPRQARAAATQPARVVQGFVPEKEPQGIVARAQELLRRQRRIEEAAQRVWRAKSGSSAALAGKAALAEACSAVRQRLLREDSAYEPLCGCRDAIKKRSVAVTDNKKEKAEWAGALVPAVELGDHGPDLTLIVVRLIDERSGATRVVQRGRAGMSGSAILGALDQELIQAAKMLGSAKPKMELMRAGNVQWTNKIESAAAGAMAA